MREPSCKILYSVVEFVVAKSHAVITQGIDHPGLKLSAELREIRSALAEIPGMKQQDLVLPDGVAHGVDESGPLYHPAPAGVGAAAYRFKMAVGVVGMDNDQPGLPLACAHGQGEQGYR